MKKEFIIYVFTLMAVFFTACGRGDTEPAATMEELHIARGIPVVVQEIEYTEFVMELSYQTSVNGLLETRVYASVADRIETIHARIGQRVAQDAIIISFPKENLHANYYQAQAAFELAEQTAQRLRNLFLSGGVSQQELNEAETMFRVAQADWEAVQQAIHVKAPIAGTISDINVRVGERVDPGEYLFTVSQMDRLHARIWIPPTDISSVRQNANVVFKWEDTEVHGTVTSIGLTLNPEQYAFAADVEFDNRNMAIRGGLTGTANIVVYRNENAISVPRSAVQTDIDGRQFVYIVQNDIAMRRYVTVGNQSKLDFEITEGLQPGDLLIVQGIQMVRDGVKVSIIWE